MKIVRQKPVIDQTKDIIRKRIYDNEYGPEGKLPSESQLADELGVSRATVRSALSAFAEGGLIIRKPGDGTYINQRVAELSKTTSNLWEFSGYIESIGHTPLIKPISLEKKPATEGEAATLEISENEEVVSFEILFLSDGIPAVFSRNIIPASLLKMPVELNELNKRIDIIINEICHRDIAFFILDINADLAVGSAADAMMVDEKTPLLQLNCNFYDKDSTLVVRGENYINQKVLKLRMGQIITLENT